MAGQKEPQPGRLVREGACWFRALHRQARRLTATAALALALTGCTSPSEYVHNGFKVGPNYSRPAAPIAEHWIDEGKPGLSTRSVEASRLVDRLPRSGPERHDLLCGQPEPERHAGRFPRSSTRPAAASVGELFPQTQTFHGAYQHQAVSIKVANRAATPQRFFSNWNYGFPPAWELDVWGKFAGSSSSPRTSSMPPSRTTTGLVTLLGDVANEYVQLRTLQAQLAYTLLNVKLQEEILSICKTRFRRWVRQQRRAGRRSGHHHPGANPAPWCRSSEMQIRKAANRLCVLMGVPPEDLLKELCARPDPQRSARGLRRHPGELLNRRPDVREAEREAAAESARIGEKEAELYPAVSLSGTLGWSSEYFPDLFNAGALDGAIAPAYSWKILDDGRIINQVAARTARFQEAATAYQQKVLTAAEEAENGIVTFLKAHQRVQHLEKSVEAARKAADIAKTQYSAGTVDFNRVAVLLQNLVDRQNLLAQAQGEVAQGVVMVYRALGGGLQVRLDGCPPNPPNVAKGEIRGRGESRRRKEQAAAASSAGEREVTLFSRDAQRNAGRPAMNGGSTRKQKAR